MGYSTDGPPAAGRTTAAVRMTGTVERTAIPAEGTDVPDGPGGGRWALLSRPGARTVVVILVALVVGRICCAAAVVAFAPHGRSLASIIDQGDGQSYLDLAVHGYPHSIAVVDPRTNEVAFFPLFPIMAAALMAASLSFTVAVSLINLVASAVAAICIAKVVDESGGRRNGADTGLMTAVFWLVQPWAFVLVLAYTEAVLVACAAACLLALLRHRWVAAGLLAALAGASRSSGMVLIVCCLVVAVPVARKQRSLVPLVAPVLAPLGTLAFFVYLRFRVGSATAWFTVERNGWHASSDPPKDVVVRFAHYFRIGQVSGVAVACYLLVCLVLLVLLVKDGNHPVLLVYAAGIFLLALGNPNYPSSIPRLLLPAFPLLLPVVVRVQKVPWRILAVAALASAVLMGLLTVYMTAYSGVSV